MKSLCKELESQIEDLETLEEHKDAELKELSEKYVISCLSLKRQALHNRLMWNTLCICLFAFEKWLYLLSIILICVLSFYWIMMIKTKQYGQFVDWSVLFDSFNFRLKSSEKLMESAKRAEENKILRELEETKARLSQHKMQAETLSAQVCTTIVNTRTLK